jgi:Tol biopolymer transport system component
VLFIFGAVLISVFHSAGIADAQGEVIAYTSLANGGWANVALFDTAHRRIFDLTPILSDERFLSWSQDGSYLAISQFDLAPQRTQTLIFSINGGGLRQYSLAGIYGAFSPDSRWLAMMRRISASQGEIVLLDTLTSAIFNLTGGRVFASGAPSWSPEGESLLFGGRVGNIDGSGDGTYQIYRVDKAGELLTPLTDLLGNNYNPIPSPNGAHILFQSAQRRAMSIMVMNTDGTNPRSMTAGDGFCEMPAWSPDSQYIAVICQGVYGQFGRGLFLAHVATRDVDFLASNVRVIQPMWTRDGEKILYASDDGHLHTIDPISGATQIVTSAPLYATERYFMVGARP